MHRRGQPIVVRPATMPDLAGIQRVAEMTWRETYKRKIQKHQIEQFLERAYSLESLEQSLQRLGAGMLVACAGDQIVGYALAGPNREGVGELFALYVLPAWQGTGTGHLLWQHATTHLRQGGFTEMVLWVLDSQRASAPLLRTPGGDRLDRATLPHRFRHDQRDRVSGVAGLGRRGLSDDRIAPQRNSIGTISSAE